MVAKASDPSDSREVPTRRQIKYIDSVRRRELDGPAGSDVRYSLSLSFVLLVSSVHHPFSPHLFLSGVSLDLLLTLL